MAKPQPKPAATNAPAATPTPTTAVQDPPPGAAHVPAAAPPTAQVPTLTPTRTITPIEDAGDFWMLLDTAKFEQIKRLSAIFADSGLVPEHFAKNPQACFVAMTLAMQLRVQPFMLMNDLYMVHGKFGMQGKLVIALMKMSGKIVGDPRWEFTGEKKKPDWTCTCRVTMKDSGEIVELPLSWETVCAEGWPAKSQSKWPTMPEQMFKYRTATWLCRLYMPEVLLGLRTVDELVDIERDVADVPAIERTGGEEPAPGTKGRVHGALDRATQIIDVPFESSGKPAAAAQEPAKAAGEGGEPEKAKEAAPAGQEPAGGAQGGQPGELPLGGDNEPPMPFTAIVQAIRKAKSKDAADVALDAANHPGYSDGERVKAKMVYDEKCAGEWAPPAA